ncbi:MAG: C4-dicarboxylate ABC transporter substrate-binding protein, partial [Alphaproteobacteria bacterium]|nr:C4-dicarboxylate ABC transporter substrate-binding protein [Alphaproteobacteria bacterium]
MDVRSGLSRWLTSGTVALAIAVLAGGAAAQTIKICHIASTEDEDHKGALVFQEFVQVASNGKLKVEVYPGGQLCNNFRLCLESVQIGTCEITGTTVGGIAALFPEIQVTDLPYMFPDDRVAEKVMKSEFIDEVRKEVLKKTGTLRLMG